MKSALSKYDRNRFMEQIDVEGGRFHIQDYRISICLFDYGCVMLRHVEEENNLCGGGVVPFDAINFWQTL